MSGLEETPAGFFFRLISKGTASLGPIVIVLVWDSYPLLEISILCFPAGSVTFVIPDPLDLYFFP